MLIIGIALILGLALGLGLPALLQLVKRRSRIQQAQGLAQELISSAQRRADETITQAQTRCQEMEARQRQRYQKETASRLARLKALEERVKEQRSQIDREYNASDRELQKAQQVLSERQTLCANRQKKFEEKKAQLRVNREQLIEQLAQASHSERQASQIQVLEKIEQQLTTEIRKKANRYDEDVRENADEIAKRILSTVLSRFPREYCPERGIGVIEIPNPEVKQKLIAKDSEILKKVESLCGVDVSIQEETGTLAVSGFDPVRRELTTRSLEKLVKERQLTVDSVQRIVDKTKKDLLRRIEEDGRRVAKELGQSQFHPEIEKMLGSLRYRYSFAQNQYFHVAEVGWLCGLLASEIGDHIPSAKRAGLLHDIGKAMDHSIEGGHAVIGADFILERGEQPHVVHGVRAHHFEEQPKTDLAYLVIAADAISGARPGARRSTVNSYNQKMEVLETIGDGFKGVVKTLVFNAGREVRIIVDGHKVSDEQSLVLCRDIAHKIENELSYPGQIKVVVVRETHAEAIAK